MEKELSGKFLNELCDCDRYIRWICTRCIVEEREFTRDYFEEHTVFEGNEKETKSVWDRRCASLYPTSIYVLRSFGINPR
jgi:hypothetical protein